MELQTTKRGPLDDKGSANGPSFAETEAALEKAGRVEELIRLYESRSREVAPRDGVPLLVKAGELARERMKNLPRAEELFRRALLVAPQGLEVLSSLRALYEQKQDAASLAEVLERLASLSKGNEAQAGAALYLKAADLYEQKLGRKDRAILCCQMATRAAPKERASYRRIRALLIAEQRWTSAFDSIERERAALGPASMTEEFISLAEKLVDDPTEHGLALKALHFAAQLEPKNERIDKAQKAIQKFEHTWRDRVRMLRGASLEERDRKNAARLSLLVAKLFAWYDSGSTGKVKEALDRCFLLWPAMPDALALIERIAEKNDDFPTAVATLERLSGEAKERTAQVDLLLRLGTLKLSRQNDPAGALVAFEKAALADPTRADASSLAAELYLEQGKHDEAVAILERHLGTVKDRSAQVALRLRLSDLCSNQLGDKPSARMHLQAALKLDPTNATAAFQLAKLHLDEDQAELAEKLLDVALYAPRSSNERLSFCEALAMTLEEKGQHMAAFSTLARALLIDPTRPLLLSTMVEQAQKSGAEAELPLALRRAAQAAPEPAATVLWRSLAQLLESPLSRPDEALAAWAEVKRRAPNDAAADQAIARLKAPPAPAAASGKVLIEDPKLKLEAEAKRLESAAAEPAQLAQLYRKLLQLEPKDVSVLKKLGACCAALAQWDEVARVAAQMAELSSGAERQEWRSRLAQLYAERLSKKDEAATIYLALLSDGVSSAAVVGGLERLASQGVRQVEISRALAPHYARSGDHQRQVASLLVQLSSAQTADQKKQLLSLLATTQEKSLADLRAAFEFRQRGLQVDPADAEFRLETVRLARELSAHAEGARVLLELGGKVPDAALAKNLLLQAAALAEEGGAIDDAGNALARALERSPDDPSVLAHLIDLYAKSGRFAECDQVLRRRLLIAEGEEKAQLYLKLADVSAELKRPREASQALQEAIKAGLSEAEHLPRLCELLEQGGRVGELSSTLQRAIELAEQDGDKDKVARLSLKRAQVLEASLGDKGEALRNYASILEQRPSDPDALAALEHLLGDTACREEAARALVPAYEALKEHRKLVSALDVIAESAQDDLEKVLSLKKAAYVHLNHLRQPELAFATLARAIKIAPADLSIRNAARQAAQDADILDSYAEAVEEIAEAQTGAVKSSLCRELADVYEKKLNNRDGAVKNLRDALAIDPKNADVLKSLQRLHRAAEEWAALAEITEKLAQVVPEATEKVALWREAAQLHEQRLQDSESAAGAWRQIAERDPLDREAASALDRLYTELERPQELAFALELRRAQEGQSPQGRELAFRLAQLRQQRLSDSAGALQLYRQILTEDPGHAGAREALEDWAKLAVPEATAALEILDPVLIQMGDHQMRVNLREAQIPRALSDEKAKLAAEVRAIYERDLNQIDLAFMSAVKSFGADIDRQGMRPDLERLAKATSNLEALAEVYENAAGSANPVDDATLSFLRRAAELRDELGQPEEAVRLWKDLLISAPQDRQALDSLGKLYEKSSNAKNLSEVYAKKAQLSQDPTERHELLLKAAAAYETAGEDAQAIEALRTALAIRKSPDGLLPLDRLYGKAHRTDEQADVLDQLASIAEDEETRKGYLARRAALLEKDGGPGEALNAYVRVLELAPADAQAIAGIERLLTRDAVKLEAARILEPIYRSLNDQKKLVEILELRTVGAEPARRRNLTEEIATLREALGQKQLAFAARLRVFVEAPDREESREQLERLAAETGSFEELAAAYEDELERLARIEPKDADTEALTLDLHRRLAVIYGERMSRLDLAARCYEEVARRDPQNIRPLEALSAIYKKGRNLKELASVMKRQVNLEKTAAAQVSLLFELGALAEEGLADKALAATCYQAILQRQADDPNAIKFLSRVLAESERWPELAQLITREIQLAEGKNATEEAFELMVRLGRLKLSRLNDPRGALDTFNEVLQRRAGHAGAVGALEEMARSDSPLRGEAASSLEPVFATGGDHLKLVQMLESRVSAEVAPSERVLLLHKIVDLYSGPMENPAMAFLAATRALKERPDDEKSLALCLQLAEAAEAEDELAALLEEVATKASDEKARAGLYRALAQVKQKAGEEDEATEAWRRVLELLPSDPEALAHIAKLFEKQGKSPELLEVLRRTLTLTEDNAVRVPLLARIGALQNDALEDPLGALATYRRLLELDSTHAEALEKMEDLCQRLERWPELADVIAKRLALFPADGALDLKFRLAQVREAKLLDRFGAVALYSEILAANPQHPNALDRLEAIAEKEPQNLTVLDVLLRAYRSSGDGQKLAQTLEIRTQGTTDPWERKSLMIELAALREGQGEPEMAFLALFRAFKEDPNDAGLRGRLEKIADKARTHDELVAAYEEELPRVAEAADAAQIAFKLGQLLEQKLKEPERAISYYEKARTLDPSVSAKALPALDRLYSDLHQHEPLAGVLEAQALAATESQEKVGFLFRLGQLAQEHLGSPDRAAAAYEQILEVDPAHLASARLLEKLYAEAGRNDKLYAILKLQRDLVQGPEKEGILARMAQVSAEGLADVDHSIELFRELLAKNPRNEQAFSSLEQLLEKAQRFDELKELLQKKVAQTLDPRELVRLNDKIGRVVFHMLGKAEDAIPFFKSALERDARHKGALEALVQIYDALKRNEDLVVVLRRLVPLQEGAEGVKAIRIRLAEVLASMNRREEALDAARRALEVEPHQVPELNRVKDIFLNLRAYADVVRALELRANLFLNMEERENAITTLFEVVDLWRGPASKPELAGSAIEKILELDPANRSAYEQACSVYSSVNDWRSYATVVDRYLPNLVTDDEKLAALLDLAKVQEQKLGQKTQAFIALCRAIQLDASQEGVREEVERLAEETSSYDELAAVYEEVADTLPRGPLAERLLLSLARIQDQKLDDADEAESALRKILEFDPTNAVALDQLAGVFSRRGKDKELVVALEQKLETAGSIEARKQILGEIARIYDERKNDVDEAAHALLRSLELEPDLETLGVLTALYRREKKWGEVVSALMRTRDLSSTPEAQARVQLEIATIYEREVQDDEAAISAYVQVLEFNPAEAEALDSLERLYTKLDRPADLLHIYQRQLELTPDYRERVKIFFKSAAIWEDKYQNLENADICVESILQIDQTNLQAIKTLERLRKQQQRWEDLVHVLDRHIQLTTSPEEQAQLFVEVGDVFHQQLKQVDRAVNSYSHALTVNPASREAIHALGNLYERSGNWPFALEMLSREAQVLGQSADAVEVWHRIGKINEDMLMDIGSARSAYEQALAIDPGYLPSIRSLKGIHESTQDWGAYEQSLVQEAEKTEEPEAKAKALLEVARFHEKTKEDVETAAHWYEQALRLAPSSLEAARPLADVYIAREDWASGEKMLDIVTQQMPAVAANDPDGSITKDFCRQVYRLGYVTEKLGKKDKALASYERAYQLDATYLPALEGLGNLLVQAKRYDEALKVYQTILIHHRDDLTDLEVVEVYWQLGDIHTALKQYDRAQNHFEKALGIDPQHEPSLRALMGLADGAGKWDKAAEYRQALIQVLDGDARFGMCVELGMLAREKLKDVYTAIDAYVGASKMRPEALEVWDALYVLYRETKQGAKAAEVVERMLALPELKKQPQKAKRVHFALGEISRDELKEPDRAVSAFNAALDLDPRFVEAFSAIESLLSSQKQWKKLEENYARMIQRLPKTEETHAARMALWRTLGDLYLKILKQPENALMAYQVVATGLPNESAVQETYAELASQTPGNEEKAIAAYRRALVNTHNAAKDVSAIAELAARRKDYDAAYLAAQVSAGLLGQAGEGEREILTKLTPYAKKREAAQRPLSDQLWQTQVLHPSNRGPLSQLMAILFHEVGHLYAVPLSQYQVNPKKHRIDVASAQEYPLAHYRYVARLLGMEAVELYSPFLVATRERMAKRSNEPAPEPLVGVEICHTQPVCLKIGGKYLTGLEQKESYYLLGRTMALLRPELALTARVSAERLEAVMQAAISLSVQNFRFTVHPNAIDAERKLWEKVLSEPARAALARVTREYVKTATPLDFKNYLEGAELSAVRAGLFVAGEVEPVKKMVTGESGAAFRVPAKTKLKELMLFALSDELHALRTAVGTNVEVQVRR